MYNGIPVLGVNFGHLFLKHPLVFGCIGAFSAVGAGTFGEDFDKVVSFTFDDGRASVYETVFPEFATRNITGSLHLNASTIGEKDRLTPSEIFVMERTGWYVANHTLTHPDLTKLEMADVNFEVSANLVELAKFSDKGVTAFSSPFGYYTDDVLEVASEYHDYHFRSYGGMNVVGAIDPMEIARYQLDFRNEKTADEVCQEVVGSVNTWTVFNAHDVTTDPEQVADYVLHIDYLTNLVDCLQENGIVILPAEEVADSLF